MSPPYSSDLSRLGPGSRFAVVYFTLFCVFGVVTPYLQKLLHLQGFNEKEIGYLLAVFETVGIVAPPLWGWLSDHSRHRRRLLLATILGAAVMFAVLGRVGSFWLAAVAAGLFGLFYRPTIPLTDGMVLRYLAEHGGDYGRPRTAGSISFIVVVLAVERAGVSGPHARAIIIGAALVCSALYGLSIGLLPLTDRERAERAAPARPRRHFQWSLFAQGPFLALTVAAFLGRVALTGYYSFFTLFLQEELGYKHAGYLWLLGPLSEIPVIFFSSAIIRRIGVRNLFALGMVGVAARILGYGFAPSIAWIIPLQFLHMLTFGAFHTSSIHYLQRLVPPDMKQSATAVFAALTIGLGAIVGSALGGVLIYHMGYRFMYLTYGSVALVALAGVFLFVREPAPAQRG